MTKKNATKFNERFTNCPNDFEELCQFTEINNALNIGMNIPFFDKKIKNNEFCKLLNASYEFKEIKQKWIKKGAVKPIDFSPTTFEDWSNKYWLELTSAGIIKYFIKNVSTLEKCSSTDKGYESLEKAMQLVYKQFSTILVVDNVVQQLFLLSLDSLLKHGIQSPFFSKRQHSLLARETMTKMALYFLYLHLVPDFFLAHISNMEGINFQQLHRYGYQNGIVFYENNLYEIDVQTETKIPIKSAATNEAMETQFKTFSKNIIYGCSENTSIDDDIHLFDLCAKTTGRSFMKFNATDNLIIDTAHAITHHFFDSMIESKDEIKKFARNMKKLAIKQKKIQRKITNMTVAELLITDFSNFI